MTRALALAIVLGFAVAIIVRRVEIVSITEDDETDGAGDYGPLPLVGYRIGRASPYIH